MLRFLKGSAVLRATRAGFWRRDAKCNFGATAKPPAPRKRLKYRPLKRMVNKKEILCLRGTLGIGRHLRHEVLRCSKITVASLGSTATSGEDRPFVHSVPSVISLSEKDKSCRRLCTGGEEERRGIRFPPTSSSSPPFPSCLLKFLSGISGQWRAGW